jgi:hypothetical protein
MIAIDANGPALEECKRLRGGSVLYWHGRAEDWAAQHSRDDAPLSVFLDLCAPLGTATLRTICETANWLSGRDDVLCVNLLKGRENSRERRSQGVDSMSVGLPFGGQRQLLVERRHAWRKRLEGILVGQETDVRDVLKSMVSSYPGSSSLTARVCLLSEALRLSTGFDWVPQLVVEYKGHASPMLSVVFKHDGASANRYWRMDHFAFLHGDSLDAVWSRARLASSVEVARYQTVEDDQVGPCVRETELVPCVRFKESESIAYVRRSCIADQKNWSAFAVSSRQAAAWRAHKTMGTYDRKSA